MVSLRSHLWIQQRWKTYGAPRISTDLSSGDNLTLRNDHALIGEGGEEADYSFMVWFSTPGRIWQNGEGEERMLATPGVRITSEKEQRN